MSFLRNCRFPIVECRVAGGRRVGTAVRGRALSAQRVGIDRAKPRTYLHGGQTDADRRRDEVGSAGRDRGRCAGEGNRKEEVEVEVKAEERTRQTGESRIQNPETRVQNGGGGEARGKRQNWQEEARG
jgi:hypothetical protein